VETDIRNLEKYCYDIYFDNTYLEKFKKETSEDKKQKLEKNIQKWNEIENKDFSKLSLKLKNIKKSKGLYFNNKKFFEIIKNYPFLCASLNVYSAWRHFKNYYNRRIFVRDVIDILERNFEKENKILSCYYHNSVNNNIKWPSLVISLRKIKKQKTLKQLNTYFKNMPKDDIEINSSFQIQIPKKCECGNEKIFRWGHIYNCSECKKRFHVCYKRWHKKSEFTQLIH